MNKTLSITLTVLAVLALAAVIFFAGSMYARINTLGPGNMMSGYGWNNNTYGPSMTFAPGAHLPRTQVAESAGVNGRGSIMMGGNGGMMNGGGPSMMGGYGYNNASLPTLTIDQAKAAAEKYLANLDNTDLEIVEIMIFDNSGYVVVKESSTGIGAFELLVDPVSQTVYPEHGPNMMWNLKYSGVNHDNRMGGNGGMMGMMGGGMMNGYGEMRQGWNSTTLRDVNAALTITPEQAIQYAQKYLDANIPGVTAATDPIEFYGYYTIDFEKDGKVVGMLSVNGFGGQVFLHTWHGTFIEETEYE